MSARNPFGWDLPPGCTNRHIDEAMGANEDPHVCEDCQEVFEPEGKEKKCPACSKLSPCCGVEFDKDLGICPECKEHV